MHATRKIIKALNDGSPNGNGNTAHVLLIIVLSYAGWGRAEIVDLVLLSVVDLDMPCQLDIIIIQAVA